MVFLLLPFLVWNLADRDPVLAKQDTLRLFDTKEKIIGSAELLLTSRESKAIPDLILNISTISPDCGSGNGAIVISVSNGMAPYSFTITNQYGNTKSQNNGNFRRLGEAIYQVRVTDQEGNIGTANVVLTNTNPPIRSFVQSIRRASSCTSRDASFRVLPSGGTPPFEYSLDNINFQASNVFENVAPGLYQIVIRDAAGCRQHTTNFLTHGDLYPSFGCEFAYRRNIRTGTCRNTARIDADYEINGHRVVAYSTDGVNYLPLGPIENLSSGVHTFYFRSEIGEVVIHAYSFLQLCPLLINAVASPAACGVASGSVRLSAEEGYPPYTFSMDGIQFQSSGEFNNLAAGSYMFTVKDHNGTEYSELVEITDDCPRVTVSQQPESCARNNGSITATGTGGAAPYRYTIDGINFQDQPVFTGLAAGEYTVTMIDVNGNRATAIAEVLYSCMTLNLAQQAPACGNNNGSLTVQVNGGTGPYQYSFDGVNFQASPVFTGLGAGRYSIRVRDANQGQVSAEAVLIDQFGLTMSATSIAASCAGNDGQISITAQGGGGAYRYSLAGSAPQADGLFTGLAPGSYTAQVTDASGCVTTETVVIDLNNTLEVEMPAPLTICEGESAQLLVRSNATGFAWTPSQGVSNITEESPWVTPVTTTTYHLEAELGVCRATGSAMVMVNKAPVANAGRDTVICYGASLQLQGSGGIAYHWTPANNLSDYQSAAPFILRTFSDEVYVLRVTDENGCKSLVPDEVAITVTPAPKIFAGNDTTIVMNQPYQLSAVDMNNSRFTGYSWTPAAGLNNANIANPITTLSAPITYTVTARTAAGCIATDDINLKMMAGPEVYVPTAFSPNGDGLNDRLMIVTVGVQRINYFRIFNRWGELLYSATDTRQGWDGSWKGKKQDTGVYTWMVEAVDDKGNRINKKGTITLIK